MVTAVRPDAPTAYRVWPVGTAVTVFSGATVSVTWATVTRVELGWAGFTWAAVTAFAIASVCGITRSLAFRHPSARQFSTYDDACQAADVVRRLHFSGLEFLASDAWDHLSRASVGRHYREFEALRDGLDETIRAAMTRSPDAEIVREFGAHVRELNKKLREDPKQLG